MTRSYEFTALTDLWTGDINRKPDRLITTGLLGSIRWWFEVLVRGLGGTACDPSADTKACQGRQHCVVCELFGCTGWARKFRFDVLNANDAIQSAQIERGVDFKFRFTPLRAIAPEEWALLDLTLRLIAKYGAIGGKTVFKPTDEDHRQREPHHQDYGLVKLTAPKPNALEQKPLEDHVRRFHAGDGADRSWASLKHFWVVPGEYLARQSPDKSTFNDVLKREPSKKCNDCDKVHDPSAKCPKTTRHPKRRSESMIAGVTAADRWLAGDQQVSKKVFSFREPPRTYGFINPTGDDDKVTLEEIKERLGAAWQRTIVEEGVAAGDKCQIQLLTGSKILEDLLRAQEVKL